MNHNFFFWWLQKLKVSMVDTICMSKHCHSNIEWGFMYYGVISQMLDIIPAVASQLEDFGLNDCITSWRWQELCFLLHSLLGAYSSLWNAIFIFWMHNRKSVPLSLVMYILPLDCGLRSAPLWAFLHASVAAEFQLFLCCVWVSKSTVISSLQEQEKVWARGARDCHLHQAGWFCPCSSKA